MGHCPGSLLITSIYIYCTYYLNVENTKLKTTIRSLIRQLPAVLQLTHLYIECIEIHIPLEALATNEPHARAREHTHARTRAAKGWLGEQEAGLLHPQRSTEAGRSSARRIQYETMKGDFTPSGREMPPVY